MKRVVSLVINAVYASQGRMFHRDPDIPILSLQIKGFGHSMNYSMAGDRD
uniref:Uncharacterized protein n=1 Tax=Picea glauca TaxID=3330 RepID=A0A101LY76_PICGL|nr:hypothetical protein ABT39_MTgene5583 [Picea glauca]QHR89582.1 hypothetical protein Q903MT_gene3604 [Picea sitchensis]